MKTLFRVDEVVKLIESGKRLILAGDEKLLGSLPKGEWIGGTIPYFMGEDGGVVTADLIQVLELPPEIKMGKIDYYSELDLPKLPSDYLPNGFTFMLIPAGTAVHEVFAKDCSTYPGIFNQPLTGWITGVNLADLGVAQPKVFNGRDRSHSSTSALVLRLELPAGKVCRLNIINLFEQGPGDVLKFPHKGFLVKECSVNGKNRFLSEYLTEIKSDLKAPLVASYLGAMINVSFQKVDSEKKEVSLYAPVFPGIEYRIAKPVDNYEKQFESELKKLKGSPLFTCNCILNFLYANLEGKKTGGIVGPMTFGEVAYMLLNQTMVYLTIEDL